MDGGAQRGCWLLRILPINSENKFSFISAVQVLVLTSHQFMPSISLSLSILEKKYVDLDSHRDVLILLKRVKRGTLRRLHVENVARC
jgi:hypothetical protein